MATPQALTAVIRASRPVFKSTADKVVFAIHGIVLVNGFSLRKVGDGVDEAAAPGPSALPAEEADLAGWNQDGEGEAATYSFLYVAEPGAQPKQEQQLPPLLLLKCLRLAGDTGGGAGAQGELLLVSFADTASGRLPATLELQPDRYAPSLVQGAVGYEHLEELIVKVQGGLDQALEGQQPAVQAAGTSNRSTSAAASTSGRNGSSTQQEQQRQQQLQEEERRRQEEEREGGRVDPLRDDRYRPGLGPHGPPGWGRVGAGDEDLMPGGLPPPPFMGGPGGLGGVPLGPRGQGGGMMVGPENPIFAGRLRHPRGGPGFAPGPGGGVPGMRWDPISPEGLQGWNPDDFTREGRVSRDEGLNDIGRPPPGRGPDWDNMFG